jgi:hypothetical protein
VGARNHASMNSLPLQDALRLYVEEAACALHAEVLAGGEVPFELQSQPGRRGLGGPSLYSYRPLTSSFIRDRAGLLEELPARAQALRMLSRYDGLDRYLTRAGMQAGGTASARAAHALRLMLEEVFAEQSDFELRPERWRGALERLEQAALPGVAGTTVVATLHGMTICSPELQLTSGLRIAQPESIQGLPDEARAERASPHLVALLVIDEERHAEAAALGRAALAELLRALRLFGDGRVALAPLGWSRTATGAWTPLTLGSGGHPHGMLVVTQEQEDELRAFCNLVARRAPGAGATAWALRRFELGCERPTPLEALSDHLLARRALLEPEGPASALLAGRLAALCATTEARPALSERVLAAIELERALMAGTASDSAAARALAADIADHLRALLRDLVCGHLDAELPGLADELLAEAVAPAVAETTAAVEPGEGAAPLSAEEMGGDAGEPVEVLDLSV